MYPQSIAPSTNQRFLQYVRVTSDDACWMWTGCVNQNGYGLISVERRSRLAHRISWILHRGPIPEGMHVCHSCDTPLCVNPDHLFLGDAAMNNADKVAKDRQRKGERVPTSRLTADDVRAIRIRYGQGVVSNRQIAREFGVGYEAVNRIIRGVTWKHVV